MRQSVSSDYSVFAQAAGKIIHWRVSIKQTNSLSEAQSVGTWVDVTDHVQNDSFDSIKTSVETIDGKLQTDQLSLIGLDIQWWKTNIFAWTSYLECKIDFWINNLTADTITLFAGWIDNLGGQWITTADEKTNTIKFNINSYLEYAERISAVRLCQQVINQNVMNGIVGSSGSAQMGSELSPQTGFENAGDNLSVYGGYTATRIATGYNSSCCCQVTSSGGGTPSNQAYETGPSIVLGQTYRICFWAKSVSGDTNLNVQYNNKWSFTLPTTWTYFEIDYVSPINGSPVLGFYLNAIGVFLIDNLSIMQFLNGTQGVLLFNINGIFATNCNLTGYVLPKGIHTLAYQYNSGAPQMTLDDGPDVSLPASPSYVTLSDNYGHQIQIYSIPANWALVDSTQDIIVLSTGDVLPWTWYTFCSIFTVLKKLYAMIGITSYTFDNFVLSTYNGRWTTSFYELPPGDSYYANPETIYWDSTNSVLWIGIGDKVYQRNMTTNQYTSIAQLASAAGYSIVRFFPDRIISNGELWGIATKAGLQTILFCLTISTSSISSWVLTYHMPLTEAYKPYTICYIGGYFYSAYDIGGSYNNLFFGKFNCTNYAQSTTTPINGQSNGAPYNTVCVFNNNGSLSWFFIRTFPSSQLIASRYDGNVGYTPFATNLTMINSEGVYSPSDNRFYGTSSATGNLCYVNCTTGAYTEISHIGGINFVLLGSSIYFQTSDTFTPTQYLLSGSFPIGGDAFTLPNGSVMQSPCKMTIDATNNKIYLILGSSGLLAMYSPTINLALENELVGDQNTIIDVLKELANFNLRPRISSTKIGQVLRRIDQNGNLITSGNSLTLMIDNTSDLKEEKSIDVSDCVDITNSTDEVDYDGTEFGTGETDEFDAQRVNSISNDLIPTRLLPDFAYWIYKCASKVKCRYTIKTPLLPFFQYETFDGATLNYSGKIQAITTPELCTDGDFSSAGDWVLGSGWSISGGVANSGTQGNYLSKNGILTIGKTYKLELDITASTPFRLYGLIGGGWSTFLNCTTVGHQIFIGVADGTNFQLVASNSAGLNPVTIDNVSIKEVINGGVSPGIILGQTMNKDGSTEFQVEILQ